MSSSSSTLSRVSSSSSSSLVLRRLSSVRERLCPDAQEDTLSTWQWSGSGGSKKEHLDSRVSGDSVRSSSQLTGSRPFKYSATSYDQYHKYDQRYYNNYNNHY